MLLGQCSLLFVCLSLTPLTCIEQVVRLVHCDKCIWRSGNTPCYSWEHYQLQQGNIWPAQIPAIARFFPSYSWELSQVCFPCNGWYISQIQPGYCPRFTLGIVPGSTWVLSQVQPGNCPRSEHFRVNIFLCNSVDSVVVNATECNKRCFGFNPHCIQLNIFTPQLHMILIL